MPNEERSPDDVVRHMSRGGRSLWPLTRVLVGVYPTWRKFEEFTQTGLLPEEEDE